MKTEQKAIVDSTDIAKKHPFATKKGIEMLFAMLLHEGAMCPKCGYGTKVTSNRWAKCKRCGERVSRQPLE